MYGLNMKKIALSSIAVLAVVAFVVFIQSASAGPVWKVALTSTDAGSTNTAALSQQRDYLIQCDKPACFKTGSSSSLSADCSKDFVLKEAETTTSILVDGGSSETGTTLADVHTFAFKSGQDTYVVAKALDAGNPACDVYLDRRY